MNLKVGDRVKYIDDVGGGEVVEINGMVLTVEDADGFHFRVSANDVISEKRGAYSPTFKSNSTTPEVSKSRKPKGGNKHHQAGKIPFLEVDLHIHQLVADESQMTNHQMLTIQMNYVKAMLVEARDEKYEKMILIHGVGNGTLRNEIRSFIAQAKNCECREASYMDYGYGATEVRLWFN